MSINPKSLKEIIKIKFDDFFYYFQNNNSYRLSIKKLTEYITDNVLSVLPPILDKHSQLDLDDGTNPHGTTKLDVGLGNVDNTSDADKPISSATALEFTNVYNEVSTKANNYVDIANIISGYILTDTDAGKLITNSGVNVRTLVIPSSLNLPNNTIFIKGRIAIQPNAGVNIELPDTTIITSPTQFTCEADKMYVFHRKQFTGDEWILVELSTVLLTDGSGTTANGLSIDLGGVLNPAFTLIKGATDGSSLLFLGGNAENENLAQLMVNAQSVILNALTSYDGNGGGHIVNLNPGGFESTSYLTENTSSSIGNYSAGNYLHYYDNRKFNLTINSPGIAPGSGESFTINGVTFTEGIDFTGQSNNILDAQTIVGLNYSGVTDFVSVTYIDNVVYFTFSNIATVSKTIANSLFTRKFYKVEVSSDFNGLTLKDGGDGFSINKFLGEYTFTDTTTLPKGIKYADNYDATLVDDSLVPKRYVDNQVATKIGEVVEDTTPQLGGDLDLNSNDINGTGNIDITGNVIADIVQLRGGVSTQGEMSWSADEETVQLVMDGTTLHIGQDTFVHARNNTASIITKGTAVYATGTLGASGRITVAPMIANGTIPGRLFIGLAAENIAIGADGQVMTFGKIRQINTNAYTDGDVLWLSPTVAGQLTTTEPTAPNLKIATAFVIHAATNGTLMVRAEQGNDLHSDQRVQVSGLTNNDVLTWNNANQRWQNAQPTSTNIYTNNGTIGSNRVATLTDTLSFSGGRVSFDTTTNGILLPRVTTAEMNAIVSPATNLLVYNTDLNGLYRYNGSAWVALSAGYGIIAVKDSSGYPTFYADLQTAINATADIDTVYIYSDIQVTSQISIPNRTSLTIEMNGHRIWCNTTSGDFNLFRFATSGGAGTDRIFTLNGGGTLEQVGTVTSAINAAVIHFFQTGTQRQLQIFAGNTLIKAENAFSIFNQANLRLIDGGIWYSTNGTISLNTAAALIRNANIDIFTQTSQFSGTYDNCHLNTRSGAFWISGSIINSRVTGAILVAGVNVGMIMCSGNDTISNNLIENGSGAVNWAINCYYAGSSGRISNNTINSTNAGINLRYGSAFNNYIYAGSNRAITKASLGNGIAFGNTLITNATNVEAIYTTGGIGVINNYCLCLNASNTASAIRSDGASEQIIGNTAIVNNAAVANINLAGNVYLTGNVLSATGTGITGAGVNLMTNTADAYGNIKIG